MYNSELQIVLDNPSRLYSPTDAITGYVLGAEPRSILHVVLEGRVRTCLRDPKGEYQDRVPLLYECIQLEATTESSIPTFSITIPEKTSRSLAKLPGNSPDDSTVGPYWTLNWPEHDTFECQADRPLPPSMGSRFRSVQVTGSGTVSYRLLAVRSERDDLGKYTPNASCQIPLWLTTRRLSPTKFQLLCQEVDVKTMDLTVQTAQLSKQRPLSIREQLRDAFNASAPKFFFRTTTSGPRLAIPGSSLKVTVTLAVLPPPPGHLYNFPVPNISIVNINFCLRSYTGVRTLRHQLGPQKPPKSHTFKACELECRQAPCSAVFRPKDGEFARQSCVTTITLPQNILPSFKTYSIWRSYRLTCTITFLVADKQVTAKTKTDLSIVARPSGSVAVPSAVRRERDVEDDAASLQLAQAMVRTCQSTATG